ncbi:3-dehydroquinate synthase [Virgibacillus dakarensis]|uniref:3-dehydroquinate synthase n=1 Tax=Virgibacillus dakarensis TaxID=1917889 RepID=UPI000B4314F4|nr:3-dehydroquinate synthase [Virgibacillus dakarensis]MBT2214264.1 3-dehydroquinate synthase [Virgibacillus dakarensis]MTW85911.1 3-dehydroquinate synthase [Virgibacillus dakarensis]
MEKLFVQTSTHPYFIYTGEDIRFSITELLPKNYSSYFIITDDVVAKLYLDDCLQNFSQDQQVAHSIIPHGEQSKSVDTYYQLLTDALSYGLDRQSLIIALGGGVVGDIAGFVAATFMRGVDYIQIPTTILAHDSSVGGKVAINHELGKNLIGSFYPPKAVIYDTATLTTLAAREVRSGYAELMKEALIKDESFFHDLLGTSLSALTNDQLVSHLQSGMVIKAEIVEADEKESGIRKHLNLGHTLGHALEAELGYGKLTHGEAVAIGMLFALRVSEKLFSINLPYDELYNWLKQNHYPLTLKRLNPDLLLRKMKSDKKSVHNKVHMVLVKQIGQIQDVEVPDQDLALLLDTFLRELVIE